MFESGWSKDWDKFWAPIVTGQTGNEMWDSTVAIASGDPRGLDRFQREFVAVGSLEGGLLSGKTRSWKRVERSLDKRISEMSEENESQQSGPTAFQLLKKRFPKGLPLTPEAEYALYAQGREQREAFQSRYEQEHASDEKQTLTDVVAETPQQTVHESGLTVVDSVKFYKAVQELYGKFPSHYFGQTDSELVPGRMSSSTGDGGQSRSGVKVLTKVVWSPTPRPGFYPARNGNGFVKRRTY